MKRWMMGWIISLAFAAGTAGLFVLLSGAGYAEEEEHGEVVEKEVKLAEVPAPVQEILLREAKGNAIESVEVTTHDGVGIYEADWKAGGMEMEVRVVYACKLIGKKMEILTQDEKNEKAEQEGQEGEGEESEEEGEDGEERERVVSFNQVPVAVREAIIREAGEHRIGKIEQTLSDWGKAYETAWFEEGWAIEILLAPDGKLLYKEMKAAERQEGERCEEEHGRGEDEEGENGGEEEEEEEGEGGD